MSKQPALCHYFASLDTDSALYEDNSLRPYTADPIHSATLPRNYGMENGAMLNNKIAYNTGSSTVGRMPNRYIVHGDRHFASLEVSKAQRFSRSEHQLMSNNEYTDYEIIQLQHILADAIEMAAQPRRALPENYYISRLIRAIKKLSTTNV